MLLCLFQWRTLPIFLTFSWGYRDHYFISLWFRKNKGLFAPVMIYPTLVVGSELFCLLWSFCLFSFSLPCALWGLNDKVDKKGLWNQIWAWILAWPFMCLGFRVLKCTTGLSTLALIMYLEICIPQYHCEDQVSSVQSLSHIWLFMTSWITALQALLSITSSQSLLKLMPIESVMPPSHLILCRPLLLLPPIPPSIRVFSSESTLRMRWSKYWSFSFSISPFNEHPGLSSFRMDWLDLFAVQETLRSLLQHHSSKASIFPCLAFFTVQLSHPYMTTGKTIALTRWTFVGKVMYLLYSMLSRLVITIKPTWLRLMTTRN